ncbi:MAG: DUF721 domain-containing protein [Alphaproteobacteria bacterium]|nr:DUF721 domain-containing protein [Alphaproteobacteria bacterium]
MQTIDKHFRNLAKAAFQRHGFASEQVVAQWAAIVGPAVAMICAPEKIKWPRGYAEGSSLSGGTLVVCAAAGLALELQYETPRIIERVNQYLGYGAITALKIIQGNQPVRLPKTPPKPMKPEAIKAWNQEFDDIADQDLKAALGRLARFAAPNGPKPAFSTGANRVLSPSPNSSRKTL